MKKLFAAIMAVFFITHSLGCGDDNSSTEATVDAVDVESSDSATSNGDVVEEVDDGDVVDTSDAGSETDSGASEDSESHEDGSDNDQGEE